MNPKPISLLICALGGEGGGVLTEWLVETAREAGHAAQSSSIPGVAQRTGATTYYLEVFPVPLSQLGGRRPVFSLNPVPGALDALLSSELLETTRQIGNGMASPQRTLVVSSTARTLTTQERMQLGDGRSDTAALLYTVRRFSRQHHLLDMAAMARESGTVVSAVMLGAIAGSGLFPFARAHFEAVVQRSGASAAASLRGFAAGFDAVQRGTSTPLAAAPVTAPHPVQPAAPVGPDTAGLADLPPPVQAIAALGHARACEYQGGTYGALYLQRLRTVLAAEQAADPQGQHGLATTCEAARWLALWMAFDDIVRVADLKSRASRWQRVRGEVKASDADLLKLYDHFKPGVPEFAALLPQSLAQRLLAWDRRRIAAGRAPWALPLKVGTHTAGGMLALRLLAGLRRLRPLGSRYALEQQMIGQWLDAVVAGTHRHWALGHEIALCGRLIKGYGSTNERGKENLLHVITHLAPLPDASAAAQAIAQARQAALADEAGAALDATLRQHGAPARPVKEQPIRFVRKPKTASTAA